MKARQIKMQLEGTEKKIPEVILDLKAAEEKLQNIKAKILSQNANSTGEIEKYTDCLETAYKYKWGETTFKHSAFQLEYLKDPAYYDELKCLQKEVSEYQKKVEAYPVEKCYGNIPSANEEDLKELEKYINLVFQENYRFSSVIISKDLYTTQLNTLKGK
ncbi:unnamed protein product [Trichobilharzia szidati]|nr:unnamed protein product [Trichobilharzia szidati]